MHIADTYLGTRRGLEQERLELVKAEAEGETSVLIATTRAASSIEEQIENREASATKLTAKLEYPGFSVNVTPKSVCETMRECRTWTQETLSGTMAPERSA